MFQSREKTSPLLGIVEDQSSHFLNTLVWQHRNRIVELAGTIGVDKKLVCICECECVGGRLTSLAVPFFGNSSLSWVVPTPSDRRLSG